MATWSVGFDKLQVNNADEDNWGSDGDEVYLATVAFRAKLGIPGSTQTWLNEWRNRTWAEGVKEGAQRNLPANVGRAVFNNVQAFGFAEFTGNKSEPNNPAFRPEVLGVVSIALEHDGTSLATMQPILENAKKVIHGEVEKVIAKETTSLMKLTAAQMSEKLSGSAKNIVKSITPSLFDGIMIALKSGGDPDDFIDYNIDWFTDVDPGLIVCFQAMKESTDAAAGKPKPADRSEAALIARSGLNPLRGGVPLNRVYDKSGVKYTLTGSVQKTG